MGRPPNHPRMTILVVKPMVSYGIGDPPLNKSIGSSGNLMGRSPTQSNNNGHGGCLGWGSPT